MPELPEVETVAASLRRHIMGLPIESVEVYNPVVLEIGTEMDFENLKGEVISDVSRRGKYLILHLEKGRFVVVHLRMTGKMLFSKKSEPLAKHSHLRFNFSDGAELVFNDIRRFGRLWLVDDLSGVSGLNKLALEPVQAEFSAEYWQNQIARKKKSMVKAALLDQHIVAGLGNIYADEVLFAAKVHPERMVSTLTEVENQGLAAAMTAILSDAITKGGTTFRDYVDADNNKGSYQNYLKVFQKSGEPCPNCGSTLEKTKVAGRSSIFCPRCQVK